MKALFILIFIFSSNFAFADATDLANTDVENEVVRAEAAAAKARAEALITSYYNKQVRYIQNNENYDNQFEFEKVSSIEITDGLASHFNSSIPNEIGHRPQLYTPSKLRFSMRVEALQSLNPQDENNYRAAREETDPPSLYEVMTNMIVYKILYESHNKVNQPKYFELNGIMDISLFNTCQLPVLTSREAALVPSYDGESYEVQLSQVNSGYFDYITYGSEAYNEYVNWLVANNSELINAETGLLKSLDFNAYYNQFKQPAEKIKEKFFSDIPENKFQDAGQLAAGYRYERYNATQREGQVERSVQSHDKIDLLSSEVSSDGQTIVNDAKIGDLIKDFLQGDVYFNDSPVPGKHYILDKNTPESERAGYTLKKLSDLNPKILGFYCKASSSNIPNTKGADLKTLAQTINTELQEIANANESLALGVENAKIKQKYVDQCQANGDDCNALLADIRRAGCFKSAFIGLNDFFSEENREENASLYEYFNEGEDGKRFEIVEQDFPSDVALRNSSQNLSNKPLQFYSGNAVTDGSGFNYVYCNADPNKDGSLKGFDRRKDCKYGTDIEAMKNSPNLGDVGESLNIVLEKVENNEIPPREHMEKVKDHFYRVDQYSRLGIIYAVDIDRDNSRPVQVSCADGVAIRFFGEEKDGQNENPSRRLTANPFADKERHEEVIGAIVTDQPIPECRTIGRIGKGRGIAKNETRHCYRLKRNLGID